MANLKENGRKRGTFMIADLLSDSSLSGRKSQLPAEVNVCDDDTGSDVIADDAIDYSVQSPASVESRGRTHEQHGTNHRIGTDHSCYSFQREAAIPTVRHELLFAAEETLPRRHPAVIKPMVRSVRSFAKFSHRR